MDDFLDDRYPDKGNSIACICTEEGENKARDGVYEFAAGSECSSPKQPKRQCDAVGESNIEY